MKHSSKHSSNPIKKEKEVHSEKNGMSQKPIKKEKKIHGERGKTRSY